MDRQKDIRAFKVFTIENGTVIDHIDAGQAIRIIQVLNLPAGQKIVTAGLNFPSSKMGFKDIIKVEHRELTQEEANKVAIFAPHATINIIQNFEITKKFKITIPPVIQSLVVCPNPKCITNNEPMESIFYVKENDTGLEFHCKYCEKVFGRDDVREYKQ
ncbi:MAG: aspartate carbamoyltransferase regulatory subunit [Candidatus Magasanikbacteria bacterium]